VRINVDEVYNGGMAGLMKCRLSFLPLKYSGLSISANPRRISIWNPVIERVRKCLYICMASFFQWVAEYV